MVPDSVYEGILLDSNQYDVIVDAREDRCPMPLLKTKMALAKMGEGQRVCVLATDPGSVKDIPYYLSLAHLPLESADEESGVFRFVIRKQ